MQVNSYSVTKDIMKVSGTELQRLATETNELIQKLPNAMNEDVDDIFYKVENLCRKVENEADEIRWRIRNCGES